jgi:hypothetical protein
VNRLEMLFPGLTRAGYRITSPQERRYNCIAWAAGEAHQWWWPDPTGRDYWPSSVARSETLAEFRNVFRTLGYTECDLEVQEQGFEKIALFSDLSGSPTHAARQLPTGLWTSKLGELEDIEHELRALEGTEYGLVAQIMKRPITLDNGV